MIAFLQQLLKSKQCSQSKIPPAKLQKEGQDNCDDDDEDSCRKEEIGQLKALNTENRKLYECFNRLHQQHDRSLEKTSTEYEEILIYEAFVKDLSDIIAKLIIHLDCKDRQVASLLLLLEEEVNLGATTDLRAVIETREEENKEETAIIEKLSNKMSDNKTSETNDLRDLRHQQHPKYKTYNDLQSTCQKQSPQLEAETRIQELNIMNESIVIKEKHTNFQKEEGNSNCIEMTTVDQDNDMHEQLKKLMMENERLSSKNAKIEEKNKLLKKEINNIRKCNINGDDMEALILEIADKHDHIANLRSKISKLEEKVEQLERKVQFREKIIRELRRTTKNQQNQSPLLMTPPRTPELKSSRSSADLIENTLMYRNYLTVPNNLNLNIPNGDTHSLYSLSDIDQDSTGGKSMSEMNFECYDDANKEEIERLHQNVYEIESENSCNRLLITKLEDELVMIRKCEARNKQDRNLKTDKLNVLKHKIHTIGTKVLGKSSGEDAKAPKLHHNDLAIIEDELKPEIDVLNGLTKLINTTRANLEQISNENNHMIDALKAKLLESNQINQNLSAEIVRLSCAKLPNDQSGERESINSSNKDKRAAKCAIILNNNGNVNNKTCIAPTFGKSDELPPTSSSPEISSGNSSLSNGHSSLSDVINEWKQELEVKKCELRHKNATISDLQERLREKEEKICEAQNDFKSIQLERDKYCQMVAQLKSAIQYHNDSIQYLKRQNAELKEEMDMAKGKLTNHQECYDEIKKRNIELEGENNNLHITLTSMRTTIEDLKRGNSLQHSHNVDTINMLSDQLLKETIQKDEQLNRLREANLELRSRIFELNQDILDLMEIVEIQKNKRTLEDFKIAQKEQQQQIEKEISSRERDINCLKHFRSRCADIESEYLEKMASQKVKADATIKELETEITALTEQLIQSHQQTTHYDELMKQTAILQNSMQDLESQNDVLKKTIELYEKRFSELQINFEKIQFENGNLLMEIENIKSDVNDKNKRISEMTIEHQRLESEFEMQKKSCTCSAKSSPTRTSTTVMQINDLKTKLMNKSLESSKATEALKRKTQQFEKLQKTAFEEKTKLREECLKSIQTIGELKSKIQLLEMRVKEQNDDVATSRERASQNLAKLTALETELTSKNAKLEDLEKREEKWRIHAYEITHEIKSRKEDSFKREQKLLDEISAKNNLLKDQTRIILQHENSLHHLRNENDTLKQSNTSLIQQMNDVRSEMSELKLKEKGLTELLEKTEEELKMIKAEVFHLFNTSAVSEIKDVHGKMKNDTMDLQTKYQHLNDSYSKLLEENRTLYEIKNDTISAIEIFKKLQEECYEREKAYQIQIAKLQADKRNLHKDRTRLTKQLLGKHRDMIILNSELGKFRHSEDYESNSTSQYNSLQPFQPVMFPSSLAPLARSSSNPDFTSDRLSIDARNLTEKLSHVKNFWQHGIQSAVKSIVNNNVPSSQSDQPIISQPPKEEDEEHINDGDGDANGE